MKIKILSLITVLSFGIFLINLGCQPNKKNDPIKQKLEIYLDTLLLNPEIDALSLGIALNGKTYKIHKGNLLNGEKPNDQSLYEIASLTKTFTGTLLSCAILENKVKLDDDIRIYLPDSFPNLEYKNQPITFKDLVTHQSGLPRMFPNDPELFNNPNWDELPYKILELQKGFSEKQFFESLHKVELDTVPGEAFSYSNAGANLLGYLLENIYEKSFSQLLDEKLLHPLNMNNTSIDLNKIDHQKLVAGQNSNKIKMPSRGAKNMNAEGGIFSNVDDMVKYMQLHLDSKNRVIEISHQELYDGKYGDFEAGIFWQIYKDGENPDRLFQNGGAFGTSSWITLIPELNTGVFLVTNTSGQEVHQKLNETVNQILSELN